MSDAAVKFSLFRMIFGWQEQKGEVLREIRESREKALEKIDHIYAQLPSEDKWFVDQSHGEKAPRCACDDSPE